MYDLSWKELEYSVLYRKGGREFPFRVVLTPIPIDELIRYEQALVRPYVVQRDGSTTADLTETKSERIEESMFEKFFVGLHGSLASNGGYLDLNREELLAKIPAVVKSAVIRNCIGGVEPKIVREEISSFDDLLDNRVTITTEVNGQVHELTHFLREPSAGDELEYRRAVGGKVRTLPGRRQTELVIVERFAIYPELYTRLVEKVEGYLLGDTDVPLTASNKKDWEKLIPYPHMKVVVRQLFGLAEVGAEEGE